MEAIFLFHLRHHARLGCMKQQLDWSIGLVAVEATQRVTKSGVVEVKATTRVKPAKVKPAPPAPRLWRGQDVVAVWHQLLNQKWSESVGCRSPQ